MKDAFIAVQSVAGCIGLHPFQDRQTLLLRKLEQVYPEIYYHHQRSPTTPPPAAAVVGDELSAKFPDICAYLARLPVGCSPEQSHQATHYVMDAIARSNDTDLSDGELEAIYKHARNIAYKKCNLKPTASQLKTAMAWALQTHGIALKPHNRFVKRRLLGADHHHHDDDGDDVAWYLCGSADLVAVDTSDVEGMVVIVKVRLNKLQYSLADYEEAHLQALMHLMDVPTAALLELHATEGMSLQILERKAEDWAMIKEGLLVFINNVSHAAGC